MIRSGNDSVYQYGVGQRTLGQKAPLLSTLHAGTHGVGLCKRCECTDGPPSKAACIIQPHPTSPISSRYTVVSTHFPTLYLLPSLTGTSTGVLMWLPSTISPADEGLLLHIFLLTCTDLHYGLNRCSVIDHHRLGNSAGVYMVTSLHLDVGPLKTDILHVPIRSPAVIICLISILASCDDLRHIERAVEVFESIIILCSVKTKCASCGQHGCYTKPCRSSVRIPTE